MIEPDLFDVIELLVDVPKSNLRAGNRGAVVEKYGDRDYEIEFTNSKGETLALCTLSTEQILVIWQAKTKAWVSLFDRIAAAIESLSKDRKQEVLTFSRSLYKGQ